MGYRPTKTPPQRTVPPMPPTKKQKSEDVEFVVVDVDVETVVVDGEEIEMPIYKTAFVVSSEEKY